MVDSMLNLSTEHRANQLSCTTAFKDAGSGSMISDRSLQGKAPMRSAFDREPRVRVLVSLTAK